MTEAQPPELRRQALGLLMPGFVGTELPDWLRALLEDGLGSICLFGHNVDTPAQVAALTASIHSANRHAIIAIDEEGGDVSRLHQHDGSPFPGNAILGRIGDIELTRSVAREVGAQLAAVGIHLTLAPDADVNSNPDNPVIGVRSFGADPVAVAAHTAAWIDGVQAAGVAACAKHFPGHGDTATDSHLSEPVIAADAATLADRELVPFSAAIAAGTKTIMTSHIHVPAIDLEHVATFSETILGDLLRGRLGFDGVVVTDALDMVGASGTRGMPAAAVSAVAAGSDLLCLGSNNSESEIGDIVEALLIADSVGELPVGRLADAAGRCLTLARWTADRRRQAGEPSRGAANPPIVSLGEVAASFTLSDRASAMLAIAGRPVQWVRIDPEPNIAIGATPLGPFFEGGAVPSFVVPIDDRTSAVDYVAEPGALTIVVGRELHRDDGAVGAASTLRASSDALIVDMGFAHSDHVDIATFGASRLAGEALIELVRSSA
ncbi:glycoside hydrolase family 3 protein [Ilumatobacter nonamiensis]|uniref:glycoside hydrolase family 3 protein n=1 Tax=Ilumatobacter nonamiensis TaxID=467093 RepID=UPI0003473342|nr:glycoside hydrolase family 3 N-terminal domain-containing protein [Ilumatobacter nonamiensis]